jgi:hypothetical protein
MKSKYVIRIVFYFILFVLPYLGMTNCEGWNEGTMEVASCTFDSDIFRAYAYLYFSFIVLSSFMLLIPVIGYILVGILITEVIARNVGKRKRANQFEA